jgi:hypothetical protein
MRNNVFPYDGFLLRCSEANFTIRNCLRAMRKQRCPQTARVERGAPHRQIAGVLLPF